MSKFFPSKQDVTKRWALRLALGIAVIGWNISSNICAAQSDPLNAALNEQVVMVPAISGADSVQLETTVYKPPGAGPFPLLIMNHGKALGNPRQQGRDRAVIISREFVKHGYAVVIPMRKGFSKSGGDYVENACDMAGNGQIQADDLQATLNYIVTQSWADKSRILVGGQSYGGLATMAFGTRGFPGVKGLLNFAGGLRLHGGSCPWQASLVNAFAAFGKHTMVPSLWFYGANDRHFDPELAAKMHQAYVGAGGNAKLVAFGPFKSDAHSMGSSWDGVKIWWPETEKFLRQIGMPADETVVLSDEIPQQKTDFAALDNIDAVPYLKGAGREGYRAFLAKSFPRAFAVSPSGAWSWAADGDSPRTRVLANCEKNSKERCKLYAIDDYVVWPEVQQATVPLIPAAGSATGK